jgi:hypothetical protein
VTRRSPTWPAPRSGEGWRTRNLQSGAKPSANACLVQGMQLVDDASAFTLSSETRAG